MPAVLRHYRRAVTVFTGQKDDMEMKGGNCQERRHTDRLTEPALTLARCGDGPDARLIAIVRLLARRAARTVYEEERRTCRTTRS
ncbi:hypothetical protein ACHMW7_03210 [Aminobacter sp. UC22_36]|uniref:hypothetical protein n=1 Tax=Aminobacter sp. UC22_36 TaxID=3374549 RepID=UPI003756D674